jgi:hypothetical protein
MAQNMHNKKPASHPKPLEVNMTKKDLKKKLAYLESLNDHLLSELGYIDRLMRLVGFAGGLQTIKLTAQELYATEKDDELGE